LKLELQETHQKNTREGELALQISFNIVIVATKCGNAKRAKTKAKTRKARVKERKKQTNQYGFPHTKVAFKP
jgi:hypothetical protein